MAAPPSRRSRSLLLLALLFGVAALVLAVVGLNQAHTQAGHDYDGDWTLLLFEAVALVGFEPPGDPADRSDVPALAAARLLIILFAFFGVLGVVIELYPPARDGLRRIHFWWIRTWYKGTRAPVLLIGLGRIGRALATELRGRGRPVYAISRGVDETSDDRPEPGDVLRIAGDARDDAVRVRACLDQVDEVFIATGDDARNVEIGGDILFQSARTEHPLDCYVHISDPAMGAMVRSQGLLDGRGRGVTFHTFSDRTLAAHELFLGLLLDRRRGFLSEPGTDAPPAFVDAPLPLPRGDEVLHLVLVGFDVTGQTMALHAARFGHAPSRLRPRLTIYGDEALGRQPWAAFLDRHPAFAPPVLELDSPLFGDEDSWGDRPGRPGHAAWRTATQGGPQGSDPAAARRHAAVEYAVNAEFRTWPGYASASLIDDLVGRLRPWGRPARAAIIVCGEEDRRNFEVGLALQHALESRLLDVGRPGAPASSIPICVYLPAETGLAALLAGQERAGAPAGPTRPRLVAFGQREHVVTHDAITQGLIRSHAEGLRRVHQMLSGRTDARGSGVAVDLDDSNTDAVLFAEVKFEALGIRFFPARLAPEEARQHGVQPVPLLDALFHDGGQAEAEDDFSRLAPPLRERLALLGRVSPDPALEAAVRTAIEGAIDRFASELRAAGRDADLAAEMEHNRWMGERLSKGWRYGPHDTPRRQRPTFVPWSCLDDRERYYDRQQLPRLVAVRREQGAFAYVEPA